MKTIKHVKIYDSEKNSNNRIFPKHTLEEMVAEAKGKTFGVFRCEQDLHKITEDKVGSCYNLTMDGSSVYCDISLGKEYEGLYLNSSCFSRIDYIDYIDGVEVVNYARFDCLNFSTSTSWSWNKPYKIKANIMEIE